MFTDDSERSTEKKVVPNKITSVRKNKDIEEFKITEQEGETHSPLQSPEKGPVEEVKVDPPIAELNPEVISN